MLKGRRGRGRGAVPLGVFTAALWLCVGGLFPGSAAHATEAGTGAGAGAGAWLCAGRLVRTVPFEAGELRVYKSRTQACALAVARVPGERRQMVVSVQPRGGAPVRDAGRFTRYAGPVTVGAINRCVRVKGGVGTGSAATGWILC